MAAVATSSFSDVQRYLRQRRATGQVTDPRAERLAWQAYYDSQAANRARSAVIGQNNRRLDLEEERLEMADKAQDRAERAAVVGGVAELGSTTALTAMTLKDTALGAKIGLGKPGAPGVGSAPSLPIVGAAPEIGTTAAPTFAGGPVAGAKVSEGFGVAGVGAPTAASSLTAGSAAFAGGAGIAGGMAGSMLGKAVAGDKGSVVGGFAAGAGAGFLAGGPAGAIIGGVVGGLSGIVTGDK